MPRSAINQASVHQICDEVYISTGRDSTYDDIKNALGGSYSTIKPYLQSWLEKPRPIRFPLPGAIGTKATHLVEVIWGHALAHALQTIEEKDRKSAEALALKQHELDVAMQEIRNLESECDRSAASVDSLLAQRAELMVRIQGLEALAGAERAMRDERDQAREELAVARGQIHALERQIPQLLQSSWGRHIKSRRPKNGHGPQPDQAN